MIEKYSAREVKMPEKKKCFIIMPITTPKTFLPMYREDKDHFEHVLDCLFIPAIEKSNLKPIKPIAEGAELILGRTIKHIETSDFVLCDISTLNPNVFFELGVRSALNKPLCLVKDEFIKKIPFDTTGINHHTYKSSLPSWEIQEEIDQLSKHIKKSIKTSNGINELWKHFGLSSIAYPAKEKGSVEDRLDYLTVQIESLKEDIQTRQHLPSFEPLKFEPTFGPSLGITGPITPQHYTPTLSPGPPYAPGSSIPALSIYEPLMKALVDNAKEQGAKIIDYVISPDSLTIWVEKGTLTEEARGQLLRMSSIGGFVIKIVEEGNKKTKK